MRTRMCLLVVAFAVLYAAQSIAQVTTATISGTVSDSSGAVLPGAKVEITNEGTGVVRTSVTGANGRY